MKSCINHAATFPVFLGNVPYNLASGGEIRQVKISPKIVLYDEEQICPDKALIIEKVRNC